MTNQEILKGAPEGATHVDNWHLYWLIQDRDAFNWQSEGWQLISSDAENLRSLADIKRIAELEKERFTFKKIISNPAMADQEKYVHIRDMLKEQGE